MLLKSGGQTERIGESTVKDVSVYYSDNSIQLWINQSSLSYLSIEEAVELRNELNKAIKKATGL